MTWDLKTGIAAKLNWTYVFHIFFPKVIEQVDQLNGSQLEKMKKSIPGMSLA